MLRYKRDRRDRKSNNQKFEHGDLVKALDKLGVISGHYSFDRVNFFRITTFPFDKKPSSQFWSEARLIKKMTE